MGDKNPKDIKQRKKDKKKEKKPTIVIIADDKMKVK
jgi:hypothetical protein